jgi:hypothetical protein
MTPNDCHKLVLIGGLHRSGTSILTELLQQHPAASAFRDTGVPEDEGQHLQSVYPPVRLQGGAGLFGFFPKAHMTAAAEPAASLLGKRLFAQWAPHWDLERAMLVEKSPPNLIRMRFLQSLFPGARFVAILRHPLEVTLAQKRRRDTRHVPMWLLLRHWLRCHEIMVTDAPFVENLLVVRYEELVRHPGAVLARVLTFVGLDLDPAIRVEQVRADASVGYRDQWTALTRSPLWGRYTRWLADRFEHPAERYGYRLTPPYVTEPWDFRV